MIERLLSALATSARVFAEALTSPTSRAATPQEKSSDTGPSVPLEALAQMTTLAEQMTATFSETLLSVLQGRPTQVQAQSPAPLTATLFEPNYDDDSIPLAPGIESVNLRETEETSELRRLQKEREELARRLVEASANLDPQGPDRP